MLKEEEFEAAAQGVDDDMAFVRLERQYRAVLEKQLKETDNGSSAENYMITYINHTVATAKALQIDCFNHWAVPNSKSSNIWDEYQRFTMEVDHYTVQVQITNIRSKPRHSVALNEQEKKHLRAYADAIKNVIDKSDLVAAKKDRLYDKINAFVKELDRERMPLQIFHELVTSVAATGGEAADKLEPAWKWVRLAAEMIGVRQQTEQQKLPAPPKKIEQSRPKALPPSKPNGAGHRRDMDDEIPF